MKVHIFFIVCVCISVLHSFPTKKPSCTQDQVLKVFGDQFVEGISKLREYLLATEDYKNEYVSSYMKESFEVYSIVESYSGAPILQDPNVQRVKIAYARILAEFYNPDDLDYFDELVLNLNLSNTTELDSVISSDCSQDEVLSKLEQSFNFYFNYFMAQADYAQYAKDYAQLFEKFLTFYQKFEQVSQIPMLQSQAVQSIKATLVRTIADLYNYHNQGGIIGK